ncbi:hypothetical protein KM043_011756 [Ampulex compressa]|nr:hypothetical protein KM043_011756 [Ampulex compressa]
MPCPNHHRPGTTSDYKQPYPSASGQRRAKGELTKCLEEPYWSSSGISEAEDVSGATYLVKRGPSVSSFDGTPGAFREMCAFPALDQDDYNHIIPGEISTTSAAL